jgi:small acid-soluble spore protein K (minor)
MVRNKSENFPAPMKIDEPRAKAEFASTRANGSINTEPRERMHRSNQENGEQ